MIFKDSIGWRVLKYEINTKWSEDSENILEFLQVSHDHLGNFVWKKLRLHETWGRVR